MKIIIIVVYYARMNLSLFIKIFDFSSYTPYDWIAQIIGFIGSAFFIASMVQKKKVLMLIFQFLALTFLFVNLLMIHAVAGAIMDGLGAIRMAIFLFRDKHKWARHWGWIVGFCVAFLGAGAYSWITNDGWLAILPTLSCLIVTIGCTFKSPIKVRIAMMIICPLWFTYNLFFVNYAGALNEIISLTFGFIGFFAHDVPVLIQRRKDKLVTNNEENPQ